MNKNILKTFIIACFIALFISCKKENDVVNYVFEDLKVEVKLHKMTFISNSIAYICGENNENLG